MSFSQDTSKIIITSEQLKTACLIFSEHKKLSSSVPLLNQRIENLTLINNSWERTDSLRKTQILSYKEEIDLNKRTIENLNKSLKTRKNIIKYGTAGFCVVIVLCLLMK